MRRGDEDDEVQKERDASGQRARECARASRPGLRSLMNYLFAWIRLNIESIFGKTRPSSAWPEH